MVSIVAAVLSGCGGHAPTEPTPRASETPTSLEAVTQTIKLDTLQPRLELSGTVNPTEAGAVAVTTPLDGVVIRPLVKIGDYVREGQPMAELNSVFGQTPLQVMNQLETFQNAMMDAQKNLTQAQTGLAQARTALGQALAAISTAQSAEGQAAAELTAARKDLRRKIELEHVGVFAKADVDEARDRAGKAEAVYHDAQNQVLIARRLVPYDKATIAELQKAVDFGKSEVVVARNAYARGRAVLGQSSLTGTELPSGLAADLVPGSGMSQETAGRASRFPLRAPISGIVTDLSMTPGLKITNSTPVGNVTDIRQVYVDANAFETDVAPLRVGDAIQCVAVAYPNHPFKGHISYISRRVQSDTRAILVRSLIDNSQGLLRPSMFVKVTIEMPKESGVILLPDSAVLSMGAEHYVVLRTAKGKYEKRNVTVGSRANGKTEIKSGVRVGDEVVTQGDLLLDMGDEKSE